MGAERIVVLGASGATGRRVVRLAAAAGLSPVAAGRRREALEAVTAGFAGVELRVGSLSPDDLDRQCADAGVVVSGVGPSTMFGAAIVEAALRAGAHYVDFSGEPRWVQHVAAHCAPTAEARGCVLVPAVGLGAAADLAARRAAAGLEDVRELTIAYRIRGMRPSVATVRSTVEIIAGGLPVAEPGGVRFVRAGGVSPSLPGGAGIGFPTPDPIVLRTEWPEAVIRTWMEAPLPAVGGRALTAVASVLSGPGALRAVRRSLAWWADRPGRHRLAGGGVVTATALAVSSGGARHVARVHVRDVYDVTARAGFAAALGLLRGHALPGLATWGAAVGDSAVAAKAIGARLDPIKR